MMALFKKFNETLLEDGSLWLMADQSFDLIRYDKPLMLNFTNLLLIYYLDIFKSFNGESYALEILKTDYENIVKMMRYDKVSENLKQIQTFLHRLNYNISIDMAFSQLILDLQKIEGGNYMLVAQVRFKPAGKKYYFDPKSFEVGNDSLVVVETIRGIELGKIVGQLIEVSEKELHSELKPIIRLATKKGC